MWDIKRLCGLLPQGIPCDRLHVFDEVDSTNLVIRRMALAGAPEGTIALAGCQSAGRGRLGRSFASPPEGGLYISILLRPDIPAADCALLTPCAGVCVCEAAEEVCGIRPGLKWVNDVLLNGKKICGILTESVLCGTAESSFVILGIGINVNTDPAQFPPEVAQVASSIAQETGSAVDMEALAASLVKRIHALRKGFPGNVPLYHRRYGDRLETLGQTVTLLGDTSGTPYTVRGLDDRFGLRIEGPDGAERTLCSGEVSVRPIKKDGH